MCLETDKMYDTRPLWAALLILISFLYSGLMIAMPILAMSDGVNSNNPGEIFLGFAWLIIGVVIPIAGICIWHFRKKNRDRAMYTAIGVIPNTV